MTDAERYFAGWVELDRIDRSGMTDDEKDAAIDATIAKHNMDELWLTLDMQQLDVMIREHCRMTQGQ